MPEMNADSYRKAIADLREQRGALQKQRADLTRVAERIDQKLEQIEAAIANLCAVIDEPDTEAYEGKLADAIRATWAIRPLAALAGRNPKEIRDQLVLAGYKLTQHSNPLAAIHGVLKRMEQSGEIGGRDVENRGRVYTPIRPKAAVPPPDREPGVRGVIRDAIGVKNGEIPVTPRKYERIESLTPKPEKNK